LAKPHKSNSTKELENSSTIPNGGKLNKNKNKKQKKMMTTLMQPGRDYSGELLLSVSRELKPSKPYAERAVTKDAGI
ncbi:hypothetical protein LINPERHAP2_LOCUS15544, partial [Linum perenne]